MTRPPVLAALAAASAALALACARAPEPAPEYAEARRRHAALAARPDAATSPEMAEVLALLARVPSGSPDAPAAAELRTRIEADRAAATEERARRAAAAEKAAAPPSFPAGALAPPPPLRLAPGAKLAELEQQGNGCFVREGPVEIEEGDRVRPGEAWKLKDDVACAERFAAQRGQWLLFAGGAFVSARPASDARVVPRALPVAPVPAPASAAAPRAPGATSTPAAGGAR